MSRNTALAFALLAAAASPVALAQDAMTPTTTADPATQATPQTPVDPAPDTTPQTPMADPAQPPSPTPVDPAAQPTPTPATPTVPTTPTSPTPPPAPTGTGTAVIMQDGQEVRINSRPPDSVVGQYRIDFAALDGNGDGHLSRSEARANESLSAEFDAADRNRDGRLSQEELSGWSR
ncbi:hypothetical protein [Luteimonas sp. R10]|uniref:hypothetical protein n=1 Tax=Luteimonas sp. R10 TaxID=3108176 RepID=UPI00308561F7|nr:hypothetical protein U3649_07435 [Luteimonas sp. R10]